MREQRGFNIIETLIFVALVVVLAIAVVPNINMFLGVDKKLSAANVEAINARTAAIAYENNEGKYPADSDILVDKNYIGETRAYYTFDIGNGRIMDANTDTLGHIPADPWKGIRWDYTLGSWVKQ